MPQTIYTCFDGDEDIHYYNLLKAWDSHRGIDFTFVNAHDITQARDTSSEETIKRSLRTRLNASDVMLVLVGEKTKNLYKYVRWELEVAIEKGMPIIAVNLNKKREMDDDCCPPILKSNLVMHIGFEQKIINFALSNWPSQAKTESAKGNTGPFYYRSEFYSS